MIVLLDHKNCNISTEIWKIFQESYLVEAHLLRAVDFPPLNRTDKQISETDNLFYGFYNDNNLCGVLELDVHDQSSHIQSLVVLPSYFRRGIASRLINFILLEYDCSLFTVETGVGNVPAITLYKNLGFQELTQWDTDHGVRKIRLQFVR